LIAGVGNLTVSMKETLLARIDYSEVWRVISVCMMIGDPEEQDQVLPVFKALMLLKQKKSVVEYHL